MRWAWNLSGNELEAKASRQSAAKMCIGRLRNPCRNNQWLAQVVSAGTHLRENHLGTRSWVAEPDPANGVHVRLFRVARLGLADVSRVLTASCTAELRSSNCRIPAGILSTMASFASPTIQSARPRPKMISRPASINLEGSSNFIEKFVSAGHVNVAHSL